MDRRAFIASKAATSITDLPVNAGLDTGFVMLNVGALSPLGGGIQWATRQLPAV